MTATRVTIKCSCGRAIGYVEPIGPDAVLHATFVDSGLVPTSVDHERGPGAMTPEQWAHWQTFGGVEVPIEYQVVPVVIRVFEMDDNVSVWCEEKCGYREIVKSRLATTLARVLHGAGDPVHHLAPS